MRGDRSRGKRGGVKGLEDRELLKMLQKVESIPVKVYGQDGETVCFGLTGRRWHGRSA